MSKYIKEIIITIISCLLIGSTIYIRHIDNERDISEHNLKTATEQVRQLTLKNGQQLSTINSYILDNKQLQEYLDISKSEIKELEKKVGKVAYISKVDTKIQYDTIVVQDTIYTSPDGKIIYNIDYHEQWADIHGTSIIKDSVATTTIDNISIPVPLQVGLTNDYKIWVKSDNPYLHITDIKGAVIEGSRINKKQKRWGLGVQVGIGGQYDLTRKQFGMGPYAGIGISYNFLNF